MAFDEAAWVARFVAAGGVEAEGRATAAKMREVQGRSPGTSARKPTPSRALRSADHPTADGTSTAAAPADTPAQPDGDLFGAKPESSIPAPKRAAKATAGKRGSKAVAFEARPKTQRELDLFELSMEVDAKNAKETGDLGYLATAMIYASLPHSAIEGSVFKRRNGTVSLTILNDPDIGLPYGKIPRVITAFLCTEAKRHKDTRGPEIHLGHTQAEFMAKLGLRSTGGQRGDIHRVRDQAKRLFTSTISLIGEPGNSQFHWNKVNISDKGMLLWDPQKPDTPSPWESKLTLGPAFYDECINHGVPIDLRVLQMLRSPLALDIYVWLTYRYNSIVVPTPVSWMQLQWQFGSNYSNTPQGERDFRANFKKQLRNVLAIYREARAVPNQDYLLLLPSPPHILPAPASS